MADWTQAFWDRIDAAYGEAPGPSEALKPDGSISYDIGDTLASFLASEINDSTEDVTDEMTAVTSSIRSIRRAYREVGDVLAALELRWVELNG